MHCKQSARMCDISLSAADNAPNNGQHRTKQVSEVLLNGVTLADEILSTPRPFRPISHYTPPSLCTPRRISCPQTYKLKFWDFAYRNHNVITRRVVRRKRGGVGVLENICGFPKFLNMHVNVNTLALLYSNPRRNAAAMYGRESNPCLRASQRDVAPL